MNLERKIMKQLEGQTQDMECPNCKKQIEVKIGKNAIGKCDMCKAEIEIDLAEHVKQFKKLGIS